MDSTWYKGAFPSDGLCVDRGDPSLTEELAEIQLVPQSKKGSDERLKAYLSGDGSFLSICPRETAPG